MLELHLVLSSSPTSYYLHPVIFWSTSTVNPGSASSVPVRLPPHVLYTSLSHYLDALVLLDPT